MTEPSPPSKDCTCLAWRPVRRPQVQHFVSIAKTDDDQFSDAAHGRQPEHRWWILAVLATAQLMVGQTAHQPAPS